MTAAGAIPGEADLAGARPLLAVPAPRVGSDPTNAPSYAEPGSGDDEYRHLYPLLAEYAASAPGDPRRVELRERLITGYLPVARHIAWRYAQRGEPLEDLMQVASLGLINAIDRFEPGHGRGFLPYAVPTITGQVRRHFRDKAWSMRVPRRLKDLNVSINHVVVELSQDLGRAPRPSEIAARLDTSIEQVLDALDAAQAYRADSLDEMSTGEPGSSTFGDMFGEPDPEFDKFTDSYSLAPHLNALPARERAILLMRFYDEMTQSQIAERVGLSQMHVSRLLTKTLGRLRDAIQHDQPPLRATPLRTPTAGGGRAIRPTTRAGI
ncbi:MAG: polymerase sigma-B factor [Pseudonocardiales bacterium]|nr:polymerase sigma-B factor [Pseudonocardiales bacterium]